MSASTIRQARRLNVERLEDRTTPATFVVSNLNDSGAGSLREAINLANDESSHPGPDEIVFGSSALGGTINLTTFTNLSAGTAAVPQPAGPSAFLISSAITIRGTGETINRSGASAFRLFQVTAAGNLSLENLTLSGGLAQGGAGAAGGGAAGLGGAIYNQGTLTISGCTLNGNQAVGGSNTGGGNGGGGLGGPGDNSSGGAPNGGVSGIGGGFGGFGGGGAFGDGNMGGFGGGGGLGGNNGGFGGFGGGGGGVFASGIAGGFGGFGGGDGGNAGGSDPVSPGGGGAGMGGAIFNQSGTLTISNSTITGNTARGGDAVGAGAGSAFGGGLFNYSGSVTLTNDTIAGNAITAGTGTSGGTNGQAGGGALYNLSDTTSSDAIITVANTILANTTGGSDVVNYHASPRVAAINATGPNIVSVPVVNTGGASVSGTPFTIANPNLAALADNGGFTRTMAPNTGSPAIDAGSNAAATAARLTTDQRGGNYVRVFNGTVDIGAVEVQPAPQFPVGQRLAVGGLPNGSAVLFNPGTAGQFNTTPAATLSPFGALGADLRTTTGDVNGDAIRDSILITGPGVPIRVAVVSGADNSTVLVAPFDPFGGNFTGGGFIAAADLDGDGRAEFVVTPDQGGGPRVSIFSLPAIGSLQTKANFLGIDDSRFRGGARPALGDVNKDGTPDLLVAAGFGGGPRVALFGGSTLFTTQTKLVSDFFAFPDDATTLRNGIFAALGDISGDGFADLIFGGGPGGAPRVYILSGQFLISGNPNLFSQPVANFFVAGNASDRGGVRLAIKNADGDAKADLAVGSGEGSPAKVRVYLGKNFTGTGEPGTFQDLNVFGGAALTDGVFVG